MTARRAVLVTGASGFLAAWILPRLLAAGHSITASDAKPDMRRLELIGGANVARQIRLTPCDITDAAAVARLAAAARPEVILHLAALQIPACRANPVLGERVNVGGHLHMLEAARTSGARLIYTSSVAAKPRGPANAPANLYGVYKRACEDISRLYALDCGVASLGLRPHVVYGLGRDEGETSVITTAMRAAAVGEAYALPWSTRTCFQYAGDIADMVVAACGVEFSGAIASDMTDRVESTDDVVAAIRAAVPGAKVSLAGPERLSPTEGFDVAPLERVIGHRTLTPLAQGAAETIAAFRRTRGTDSR